jgi:spermidine synthase
LENRRGRSLAVAAAALGMTAVVTQILLLREFVSVFQGNELVVGVVLACWMTLTGGGAFLARCAFRFTSHRAFPAAALACAGTLPPATVVVLRVARNAVFTPGSMAGISQALGAALLVLAPFCLLSGFLFTSFVRLISSLENENRTASVYAWEALGSAAGGALFTVALTAFLETFETLSVLLLLDLLVAFVLARQAQATGTMIALPGLAGAAIAGLLLGDADTRTRQFLFPGQEIVYSRDTPYGNLTLTRSGEEVSFFENCVLMFSTNNTVPNEETVHSCMAQRRSAGRVLLIGGGIAGTTTEILKYPVEAVDYVEINPWVIRIGREYTRALEDGRVAVVDGDARMYVRSARRRYDAAIIDLPDPGTAQLNRYFTLEFFRELKAVLSDSAVISTGLLPAADYQGSEARRLTSILYATLGRVFAHVMIVPGERNRFLASDTPLDIRVARKVEERGVNTVYVNRFYIDDLRIAERSAAVVSALDTSAPVNTDFAPVCYYRQVAYWLSYFGVSSGPWAVAAGLALLLLLARFSAVGVAMSACGFAASSLEIILLVSFQVLCGSLFQMTGIVITAFMAGLAAGAFIAGAIAPRPGTGRLAAILFEIATLCLLVPVLLFSLRSMSASTVLIHCVIATVTFGAATLTGLAFAAAATAHRGSGATAASELYGLDLFGSAAGALLVSVYVIPLLGLMNASFIAGGVSAGGGLLCMLVGRRYK